MGRRDFTPVARTFDALLTIHRYSDGVSCAARRLSGVTAVAMGLKELPYDLAHR